MNNSTESDRRAFNANIILAGWKKNSEASSTQSVNTVTVYREFESDWLRDKFCDLLKKNRIEVQAVQPKRITVLVQDLVSYADAHGKSVFIASDEQKGRLF